jgi:hypothetical protein
MVDPVSLAVVALARALIVSGAKGAGEAMGNDAYYAMKTRVLKKYPAAATSIESLEREPYSRERQNNVATALRSLGGTGDPELAHLADQLMATIQNGYQSDQDDKYADANDFVTQSKHMAGIRVIDQLLARHIRLLYDLRSDHPLSDSSLLSSNISRATDLPAEVRNEVFSLHRRIREIVAQVASLIESGRYQDTDNLVQSLQSRNERELATRLVQADKAICVSYETLRLTVDFFSELNGRVLARTEQEPSVQGQNQMMFGNAIMMYELADFMIGFIQGFAPDGLSELEALYEETLERVRKAREGQKRLESKARQDGIEPSVRDGILEDLKQRNASLDMLQQEWESYVKQTKQLNNRIGEVRNKIPTLELIKDNARLQLDVLELVAMLRFLRQNDKAVRAAVRTLHGLRLVPLTPDRVRKLLGASD